MDTNKALESFLSAQRRMSHLTSAAALLQWDMETNIMPQKAGAARAEVLASIGGEAFRLGTSPEYGTALEAARAAQDTLNPVHKRMVEEAWRSYERGKKIPQDIYEEYTQSCALSALAWKEAKDANDFAAYRPHLQKLIDFKRDFAERWGYISAPYDALLEEYDPALKTAQLEPVFAKLLEGTRALLQKIPETPKPSPLHVPVDKQRAVARYLMDTIQYDTKAGNLFEVEHPFSSTIHRDDVRITTHYYENNPESAMFSTLHEGGHGMYEQCIDPKLWGTNLFAGASMGVHESQSRFWENMVGRSLAFWQKHFEPVCALAGVRLADSAEDFWRRINRVQPSLIRIEADEVTYNLHVIIRFEVEKAIFNDGANAADLPDLWNQKYKEYLGVAVPTDSVGIMQDVHWAEGMFGYFPSYTVGNLYAAQLRAALEAQLGALDTLLLQDNGPQRIKGWLAENIYKYGSLEKPAQILARVTGKELDAGPLVAYLGEKMQRVYGF